MTKKNPFGDDMAPKKKVNPFGEEEDDGGVEGAADRIDHAARKIRLLRLQIGAEGLTLSATRDLIDEITASLDAMSRALRDLNSRR
jgi:flagellin-like hook-associated protein FlgL